MKTKKKRVSFVFFFTTASTEKKNKEKDLRPGSWVHSDPVSFNVVVLELGFTGFYLVLLNFT